MRVSRDFSDPGVVQQLETVSEDELAIRLAMPIDLMRQKAKRALGELRSQAQSLGLNEMTMDEIEEIVAEVRAEREQTAGP